MRVVSQESGAQLFRVTRVIGGRYREDFVRSPRGRGRGGQPARRRPAGRARPAPLVPDLRQIVAVQGLLGDGQGARAPRQAHGAAWAADVHLLPQHRALPGHRLRRSPRRGRADLPGIRERAPPRQGAGVEGGGQGHGRALARARGRARVPPAASRFNDGGGRLRWGGRDPRLRWGGRDPPKPNPPGPTHAGRGRDGERAARGHGARHLRDPLRGRAQLVEVGIGCESCHNGARDHVQDPTKLPPSFEAEERLAPGPRRRARCARALRPAPSGINHTCVRCHTVLFSRYPYTWEGGVRAAHAGSVGGSVGGHDGRGGTQTPGGSSVNSGEARDFLLGACTGALRCTACHDPHGEDRREDLDRLGTVAGNHVCAGCHDQLRRARRAGGAHPPRARRRRERLPRLPHAPQERGPRLHADALPPHRLAHRPRPRGEEDRPLELRALPRRQVGGGARLHHGGRGGRRATTAARLPPSTATISA